MPNSFVHPAQSNPATMFVEALAAASATFVPPFAGSAIYNIGLPKASGSGRWFIRAIQYLCVQQVGLEWDFWSSATGLTNVIGTDAFVARWQFASNNGQLFNNTGLFRYYIDGLAIPYFDADSQLNAGVNPALHVACQNVDTVAKGAAGAGAVNATFWMEPQQAW